MQGKDGADVTVGEAENCDFGDEKSRNSADTDTNGEVGGEDSHNFADRDPNNVEDGQNSSKSEAQSVRLV